MNVLEGISLMRCLMKIAMVPFFSKDYLDLL